MRDFFMDKVSKLAPVFLVCNESLPQPDPDQIVDFSKRFIFAGTPAFRAAFYAMILALEGICILRRHKSVYSLSPEEADDFIQSLFNSRLTFLSVIPTILGTPIYMGHYNRDDVQAALGFDVLAMREEAANREVKR
jgi:hypothetical protein